MLSALAHHRALRLRLRTIERKVAKVEDEIATASASASSLGLFDHPGLRSLRERRADLLRTASDSEAALCK
ncbi:MAG: hypothetical protein L0338_34710 [Acidobacteria bacterium]|nr:hypothetical protein [Acidobacteriota bacterium]